MSGHVSLGSVVLVVLLWQTTVFRKPQLAKRIGNPRHFADCNLGNQLVALASKLGKTNYEFNYQRTSAWPVICIASGCISCHTCKDIPCLLLLELRKANNILPGITVHLIDSERSFVAPVKVKYRRHRCPCAYYANTTATFHTVLEGDLVFKLNPGPVNKGIDSIISVRRRPRHRMSISARNPSNLVEIHRQPLNRVLDRSSLSLCLLNARSIKNKSADFVDYVCERKFDLVAITETWLHVNDDSVRVELCPDGYKFADHPRARGRGGGTGLLYRNSLNVSKINSGETESFEYSECIVRSSSAHNIRLIIIYRPPYSEDHKVPVGTFLTEFSDYLESVILSKEHLLITGDFNIHVDASTNTYSMNFLDLLESFGLEQHVNQPTHIQGHTLDLVITRKVDDIIRTSPSVDRYFSDHGSVVCKLLVSKPVVKAKKVTYRKLRSVDLNCLKSDLATSSLCRDDHSNLLVPRDIDNLVNDYNTTLSSVIDHHAPLMTKTVTTRPKVPWFNEEIAVAKRQRRKAERVWRRTKLPLDLMVFKQKKNHVTFVMNQARRAFYAQFVDENSADQGRLFRATKKLLAPKDDLNFPDYFDTGILANDIGRFFVRKIDNIRIDLDATVIDPEDRKRLPDDPVVNNDDHKLRAFQLLSQDDVLKLLQKSAKKSCPLDPMPTSLVVSCMKELLPVISCMLNSSLSSGYFPSEWKAALVDPRLKKTGQETTFKNLRPVSQLHFVSKLTERAVFNQMHEHMTRFGLYPLLQSAYREFHSTETALLKVHNDILSNMDRQRVTLLVLLDLSAAFDTVDHGVLLSRLETSFGITDTALDWLGSYLSGRSYRVCINGCYSEGFALPYGVPQGSCLGPMLFTIYASKLFEVIKAHLPDVHVYADDTQLYLSFKPDSNASQMDAVCAVESCLRDIRTWMAVDKLKLNDGKTEFILIGTRQQLNKVNISQITVGNASVPAVMSVRNLGAWFDLYFSMTTHINKTCQSVFYHLHNIRRIRKFLCFDSTKTLVQAVIMARIDYCNSLLFGVPAVHLSKLQRLQNSAARLVCYTPRYCHITPVLIRLHWLPVKFRIHYKVAILAFKCIHCLAPMYLCNLITVKQISRYSLRSNDGILLLAPRHITRKTLGDRAFVAAAPKVWNNLPLCIRNEDNFTRFKNLLKTHYFTEAFDFVN